METHSNGYRFYNYCEWDDIKNPRYDYARKGLLKHLMSHVIIDKAVDENGKWKPNLLGNILKFAENSLIIVMDCVKRLQNFHNPGASNR